ncbi:TIR domain-containing protein [Caulobacter sp.]|uniref:TIR domain-containing protein n=1 Tax=Caulobacter sp. TaxID=78 RepID=UPI002B4A5D45|nr:TIR domain-containing protein [Caulobacter sp.]HJV42574.1 TIR domain-containing protein [Caulobacter sp.]
MDADQPAAARYWAFVSYSHRDAARGRRLHGRLERYVLPRRLVGRITPRGRTPRRLAPIFRDREEFPAAHDLSTEVRAALSVSNALIVICSPNAAASPWVAREIELFRALHPDRPILAALIAGEPDTAFPAPLRDHAEPLAADFRPAGDGERLALLKLVAGMAGVGLDELIQRDAQRRLRSVTAVTALSLSAVLAMGLLTAFALSARDEAQRQRGLALAALDEARTQRTLALNARDEAQRQRASALRARDEARRQRAVALDARAEAEDQRLEAMAMVEFMLTDLGDKLKGSERLAVRSAVNQRALDYYAGQRRLPPAATAQLARLQTARGAIFEESGDLDAAMMKFAQSFRTTTRLSEAAPKNAAYVFNHAQNEAYASKVAFIRADWKTAQAGYRRYNALAERLIALRPDNLDYRREIGYAQGNLCSVALRMRDTPAALDYCGRALRTMRDIEDRTVELRRTAASDVANRHAWMADVRQRQGDLTGAMAEREAQEKILAALLAERPKDLDTRADWIALQQGLASLAYAAGDRAGALKRLNDVRPTAVTLLEDDTDRQRAKKLLAQIDARLTYFNQQAKEDRK